MARHIPHLYVTGPWDEPSLSLPGDKVRHLVRVLRMPEGATLTYTDGAGRFGEGRWTGVVVERGAESEIHRPSELAMAVAPVKAVDRMRFLVEKLQELGVARLVWLATSFGQARPPRAAKCTAWAIGALEQSRGAWLLEIDDDRRSLTDIDRPLVAHPAGRTDWESGMTWCIGPEGGWADHELDPGVPMASLGATVLRTETAALVAAGRSISPGSHRR